MSPSKTPETLPEGTHAGRWIAGIVVAMLIGLPLGWLLSNAAQLVFFLGIFFFLLFGLLLGAASYRVAAPGQPYPRWMLIAGTAVIVLFVWSVSIYFEARSAPVELAANANEQVSLHQLEGSTAADYKAQVAEQVRDYWRETYAPGGSIGYVRWVVADGGLTPDEVPALDKLQRLPISPRHIGATWVVRVTISLVFFWLGVYSQTGGLGPRKAKAEEKEKEDVTEAPASAPKSAVDTAEESSSARFCRNCGRNLGEQPSGRCSVCGGEIEGEGSVTAEARQADLS